MPGVLVQDALRARDSLLAAAAARPRPRRPGRLRARDPGCCLDQGRGAGGAGQAEAHLQEEGGSGGGGAAREGTSDDVYYVTLRDCTILD